MADPHLTCEPRLDLPENVVVNINGELLASDQAKVSVFDRGFIYGDSLYEVARSYNGIFLYLDEHLARLQKSADLCRMVLGQSLETYRREIYRTLEAFQKRPGQTKPGLVQTEAYCRLIVTRGVGKIGFGLSCLLTPTQYVIIVQPVEPPAPEQFERGLHLEISQRIRNNPRALDPAMKSGNYLNSLLAFLEASAHDRDDALLCNSDEHLTEGTTFNIFYARNGIIATPPLDVGILDGLTRRQVIRIARDFGHEVREVRFTAEYLMNADEAFITSSIKEVFPVTRINSRKVGSGKPGPITRGLATRYREAIGEVCKP